MTCVDSLVDAAVKLETDLLSPEHLPDIAAAALAQGVDSLALHELAGTPSTDVREARDLFKRALCELGIPVPSPDDRVPLARLIASQIVRGTISPIDGARTIWWQCANDMMDKDEDWNAWSVFVGAASEWDDCPDARDDLEALIKKEAAHRLQQS